MVCRQMMSQTSTKNNLKAAMENNNFKFASSSSASSAMNNNLNCNNNIDSIDFINASQSTYLNHDDINCNIFIHNVHDVAARPAGGTFRFSSPPIATPEDYINSNNNEDVVDCLTYTNNNNNSSASTVFYPNCVLKTSSAKIGAKLRARSADYYPTVTTTQEQQEEKHSENRDVSPCLVGDHLPSCSIDHVIKKCDDCDCSATSECNNFKCADMAPVPSCVALKGAILALYRLDDFELQKIGQGFFSEVYKVRHKVNCDEMVLKSNVMTSNRPNVLKEVQLMRRLKHPNVLRFKGVCVDNGQLHALTEYCNGGSLEQCIKNLEQVFPWSLRASLSLDIARGMQYVHGCGYIHRDLTSKNVLMQDVGFRLRAVIADFGLACKIPTPGGAKLEAVGTPYWMAPECLNDESYNENSDVFSYGIILCEMIARIDADPDVMPRTATFGLDYLRYIELCPSDAPVQLLSLAFRCCLMDPNRRPSFDSVVPSALTVLKVLQRGNRGPTLDLSPTIKRLIGPLTSNLQNGNNDRNLLTQSFGTKLKRSNSDVSVELMSIHLCQINNARINARTSPASPAVMVTPQHASINPQQRASPSSDINRALAHSMAAEDPMYIPSFDGSNPFAGHTKFAGVRKFTAGHFNRASSILQNGVDDEFVDADDDQDVVDVADLLTNHRCRGVNTLLATPVRRANSLPGSPSIHTSWLKQFQQQQQQRLDEKSEQPQHVSCGPSPASRRNDTESRRRMSNFFVNVDRRFVESKFSQKKQPIKRSLTVSDPYSPSTTTTDADDVIDDDEYELRVDDVTDDCVRSSVAVDDYAGATKHSSSPDNEKVVDVAPIAATESRDDVFTLDEKTPDRCNGSRSDGGVCNKCDDADFVENLHTTRPNAMKPEKTNNVHGDFQSLDFVDSCDESPSSPETSCTGPWHPKCAIL